MLLTKYCRACSCPQGIETGKLATERDGGFQLQSRFAKDIIKLDAEFTLFECIFNERVAKENMDLFIVYWRCCKLRFHSCSRLFYKDKF